MGEVKIAGCPFDEEALYDVDNMVWARPEGRLVSVGISSVHAYVAGRIHSVKLKRAGEAVEAGRSLGTIEGARYFGVVRSPVSGTVLEVNLDAIARPKLINDFPYSRGWLVRLEPARQEELARLRPLQACREELEAQVARLKVRCFSAFPDYEMYEIGLECAAVLPKLDDMMRRIDLGEVVHLVSDDPTAPIEMTRWSEQRGQELLEVSREGDLFHILVRRKK